MIKEVYNVGHCDTKKNWIKQISFDFSTQQKQLHKRTIAALRKYLKEENSKSNPDKQYIVDTEEKITALEEYRHSKLLN